MTDPRNIAHDKRLAKEKKHHGGDHKTDNQPAAQPGKKQRVDPAPHGHDPDNDDPIDNTESGIEP